MTDPQEEERPSSSQTAPPKGRKSTKLVPTEADLFTVPPRGLVIEVSGRNHLDETFKIGGDRDWKG